MTQYQNSYAPQPAYNAPVQNNTQEGREIQDGEVFSAEQLGDYDRTYTLLPEGDYDFTVVDLKTDRYQPGPQSKIPYPCKRIKLTLRVVDPETGEQIDLFHNLYMCEIKSCLGMMAQFLDSIENHKKGDKNIAFDWRPQVIIGKTGRLALNHRANNSDPSKVYNNIKKLYPKDDVPYNTVPAQNGWVPGKL